MLTLIIWLSLSAGLLFGELSLLPASVLAPSLDVWLESKAELFVPLLCSSPASVALSVWLFSLMTVTLPAASIVAVTSLAHCCSVDSVLVFTILLPFVTVPHPVNKTKINTNEIFKYFDIIKDPF